MPMPRRLHACLRARGGLMARKTVQAALRRELAAEAEAEAEAEAGANAATTSSGDFAAWGAGGKHGAKDTGSANSGLAQHLDHLPPCAAHSNGRSVCIGGTSCGSSWIGDFVHLTRTLSSTISKAGPLGHRGRRRSRAPMPTAVRPATMTARCPANGCKIVIASL